MDNILDIYENDGQHFARMKQLIVAVDATNRVKSLLETHEEDDEEWYRVARLSTIQSQLVMIYDEAMELTNDFECMVVMFWLLKDFVNGEFEYLSDLTEENAHFNPQDQQNAIKWWYDRHIFFTTNSSGMIAWLREYRNNCYVILDALKARKTA